MYPGQLWNVSLAAWMPMNACPALIQSRNPCLSGIGRSPVVAQKNHAVVIFQRRRRKFLQRHFQFFLPRSFGGFIRIAGVRLQFRREPGLGMTRRLLHKIHGELAAVLCQLCENFFRSWNGTVPETRRRRDDEEFFRFGVQCGRQPDQTGAQKMFSIPLVVQGSFGTTGTGRTQMLRKETGLL